MDLELRMQVLRAAVRDRQFLKASSHDLAATDFQNKAERIVAEIALKYYDTYGEPVGAMLRTDATALEKFYKLNEKEKKELRDLVDKIQGAGMELVSVRALQDRVMMIKKNTFFERALEEIIATEEKGRLSTQTLEDLVEKAQKELTERLFASSDFLEESEKRILRRQLQSEAERFPLLLIDPLDEKINLIGRGHFGIFVGPYSSGKSLFLLHTCLAYALQGLKVLYITLEDPIDVLENRADACITGLPMSKLAKLPNRFRKRYAELRQLIRGRIKFIDGTEGGVTVSKIEKMWEQEKASGFIADAIIIDYDEELECEKKFTGEMARKREFGADLPEYSWVQAIVFGVGLAAQVVGSGVCFSCYVVAPHQDPLLGQNYQFRSDVFVHADDLVSFVPG